MDTEAKQSLAVERVIPSHGTSERSTNPTTGSSVQRWNRLMTVGARAADSHAYDQAIDAVRGALAVLDPHDGGQADSLRACTLLRLCESYLHGGHAEQALKPGTMAVELFAHQGDRGGLVEALGAQASTLRYLGRTTAAADCLARLSCVQIRRGRMHLAARKANLAALVRAGLPSLRVVAITESGAVELAGAPVGQPVRLKFARGRPDLRGAQSAVSRGRSLAGQGHLHKALACFEAASQIDPLTPDPAWLSGLCLLHLGYAQRAIVAFERSEALAPGWKTNRADLWLARRIARAPSKQSAFEVLRRIASGRLSRAGRLATAVEATERHPDLAAVWLAYAEVAEAADQPGCAKAAFERALQAEGDADTASRAALGLAAFVRTPSRRISLLHAAQQPDGSLLAAASAGIQLRQSAV